MMRAAALACVVMVCVLGQATAQKKPPAKNPYETQMAVGTIEKFDGHEITVNRLKGGEAVKIPVGPDCKFRLDGLTVEAKYIRRGMKVIVEDGSGNQRKADLIMAFDKEPLPK